MVVVRDLFKVMSPSTNYRIYQQKEGFVTEDEYTDYIEEVWRGTEKMLCPYRDHVVDFVRVVGRPYGELSDGYLHIRLG